MTRVGIVGLGTMGRTHAEAYQQMPDVEITAVFDRNPVRTEPFASDFQTFGATTLGELLNRCEIVDICVPTYRHAEFAIPAVEAGKAVVCEKPLGRTMEQCEQILEAVSKHNALFMPAHVLRFFPEFKRAHELVQGGAVGNVAAVRTRRGGDFPRASSDWYADFSKSGGVALDLIIHDFDWIRWTFGPIERVYAKSLTFQNLEHLDYTLVTMRATSGAVIHVEGTWCDPGGFRVTFEICGDAGMLEYDSRQMVALRMAKRAEGAQGGGVEVPDNPALQDPYYLELRHFVDCYQQGIQPMISAQDGYEAARIALAAIESAQTGKVISLS
ncbi:MAG: Gfo/Idh/MocA family oxidoreductase [Fimbriimonadia bacterium]|nr:Gfo/Idh/MocA family oxidoreductase [Fimbriimonadia bacterium]